MTIREIEDPIERFIAFIEEREAIRERRAKNYSWPWTHDNILQTYRFTNIHREDDAVSKHYQKTVRNHYMIDTLVLSDNPNIIDPLVLPATVLYRWFNRPSTCDAFFNQPDFKNRSVFETYIDNGEIQVLIECLTKLPTPHVTGAFIINGKQGFAKGEGVIRYFHEWCRKPWKIQWEQWLSSPPRLEEMYLWLREDATGLGTFMAAQLVADLKYLPFMLEVPDWWTWAAPGPGSMRGLNIVLGQEIFDSWKEQEWLSSLSILNEQIAPTLEEIGIGRLHNQDLQNCLCEFSKYTKVANGWGRPRQRFHHA